MKAENNGRTCFFPTIRYGSTTGGVPMVIGGAQQGFGYFDWWCVQLGFGSQATVTWGQRYCAVGALAAGRDWDGVPAMHWTDYGAGKWKDGPLTWSCAGLHAVIRLTCTN